MIKNPSKPPTAIVSQTSKFSLVSIEGPAAKAMTYAFATMLVVVELVILWRVFH